MPPWAIAVAVVIALVPAAWLTAQRAFHSPDAPTHASTDAPIPPVSPLPSTSPTPAPSPSPSATAAAPLAHVAPDAPRRLSAGDLVDSGFDNAVSRLEPASRSEVARLESRGSPGSPGTDTVVVVGEVVTGGDSAFSGLPGLEIGDTVSIRTDLGTMTYTVGAATLVEAGALPNDPVITERVPGRLVLVGIRYAASGDRLADALVVTAQLTDARAS